jgi:hypothetical protein
MIFAVAILSLICTVIVLEQIGILYKYVCIILEYNLHLETFFLAALLVTKNTGTTPTAKENLM